MFSFLHLPHPDLAGHRSTWMSPRYLRAVTTADAAVGVVLAAIDSSPDLARSAVVILTADHGGRSDHHDTVSRKENYTVPFLVWGAGVPAGADLYALNPENRLDPWTRRPGTRACNRSRNGEAANLALDLLGLPAVPGSLFDLQQDLEVLAD